MTSPRNFLQLALLAGVAACLDTPACAAEADLDLTRAVVVAPASFSARENKAVLMLIEEIEKRTQIRLTRSVAPPTDSTPSIQIQRARRRGAGTKKGGPLREGRPIARERVLSSLTKLPPLITCRRWRTGTGCTTSHRGQRTSSS